MLKTKGSFLLIIQQQDSFSSMTGTIEFSGLVAIKQLQCCLNPLHLPEMDILEGSRLFSTLANMDTKQSVEFDRALHCCHGTAFGEQQHTFKVSAHICGHRKQLRPASDGTYLKKTMVRLQRIVLHTSYHQQLQSKFCFSGFSLRYCTLPNQLSGRIKDCTSCKAFSTTSLTLALKLSEPGVWPELYVRFSPVCG